MTRSVVFFRVHAIQRMFERGISEKAVLNALELGETIEDYSSEMDLPGRLILAFQGKRPFHAVISQDKERNEITVITVYTPTPGQWSKDFKRRRA